VPVRVLPRVPPLLTSQNLPHLLSGEVLVLEEELEAPAEELIEELDWRLPCLWTGVTCIRAIDSSSERMVT